jgi:hypothetical protein
MLCLTDEALTRIMIAGTAIAPQRRSASLENLAARFERASVGLSPGARYTREWRALRTQWQVSAQARGR